MQFRDERRTCVIVATGPSAGEADLTLLDGYPCLVVNDAYRLLPGAQILYAADGKWWDYHIQAVREAFRGECWTCDAPAARRYLLRHTVIERRPGLSITPGVIYAGGTIGNSGAQAINLATLAGARRLVLVGFDMNDTGEAHFFGAHPKSIQSGLHYSTFVQQMSGMASALSALRIEVLNASPKSKLPYWPRMTLEQALPRAPTVPHPCAAPTS